MNYKEKKYKIRHPHHHSHNNRIKHDKKQQRKQQEQQQQQQRKQQEQQQQQRKKQERQKQQQQRKQARQKQQQQQQARQKKQRKKQERQKQQQINITKIVEQYTDHTCRSEHITKQVSELLKLRFNKDLFSDWANQFRIYHSERGVPEQSITNCISRTKHQYAKYILPERTAKYYYSKNKGLPETEIENLFRTVIQKNKIKLDIRSLMEKTKNQYTRLASQ
jgi:ATPase subunit of ABC transporter with duplicated ATPase domains